MESVEFLGVLGFIVCLSAYTLLQAGYLDGNRAAYTVLNLIAASLILVGLTEKISVASMLLPLGWIVISLWGLSRLRGSRLTASQRSDGLSVHGATTANPPATGIDAIKQFLQDQIRLWRLRQTIKRERNALKDLDDKLLQDIGVQRTDALDEANRLSLDMPVSRLIDAGLAGRISREAHESANETGYFNHRGRQSGRA